MTARAFLVAAGVLGATGVALGAFGAHVLSGALRPERLATFETAVRYQLLHALALLALAPAVRGHAALARVGIPLLAGTVIFSGSLYALVFSDRGAFGMVAPIGGALLVGGWVLLAGTAWRSTGRD